MHIILGIFFLVWLQADDIILHEETTVYFFFTLFLFDCIFWYCTIG